MKRFIGYFRKCDLLTMFGTVCAFIGMFLVLRLHYTSSVIFLLISGLCDAFDGKLARMGNYNINQSVYGAELDSLSDVICFGVFPALLTMSLSYSFISYIICAFYLLCGVIRLAYFNMLSITKEGKKNTFVGLPITTVSIVYPVILLIVRLINFNLLRIVMPLVLLILGICFILKFEMPKPDIGELINKIFNKYVVNYFVFPVFLVVGADIFYKLNFKNFSMISVFTTVFKYFIPFLIIICFIDIIILFFNSLFKKSINSKILLIIIVLLLLIICDIKLSIIGNPVELSDINYLNPANMHMMTTATGTIGKWIFIVLLKAIVFFIIGLIFIVLDKKYMIEIKGFLIRLLLLFICIIIINFPFVFMKYLNKIYVKKIYNFKNVEIVNNIDNDKLYYEYGVIQGLYLNEISKIATSPEGYNIKAVSSAIDVAVKNNNYKDKWPKANVVFLLSESFTDIQNVKDIKFNKSLMPNIDRYKKDKDKIVGDLLVSIYGGMSVNTEFEILTGGSISFMKSGIIPWTNYYNKHNGDKAPNIISEFNNNGYETIYLTPWKEESYKSGYIYKLFGTDKTLYGNSLPGSSKGLWYSDKDFMDDIYKLLKDSAKDNYKFIECATAQNHFPYDRKYEEYDIDIKNSDLTKSDKQMLRTYAQGIFDADKALDYLYQKIKKLDTPTIIVFFGDHLPHIANKKEENLYLDHKYFQTDNEYLNRIRQFTTKYVVLANFDLGKNDLGYINASYLGAYVINKMDLEISDYFKFIDYTRTIIPVFNREIVYKNGNTIPLDKISNKEKEQLNNYKFVQYNKFYDFGY